jgi:microsomal dipeptidase-like Zn-dependent dipeptidase/gamma-glutamyl-gamma-aminobutyrate hydrolase PuuD
MVTEQFNLNKEYAELHRRFPMSGRKPLIGISGNFSEGNCCLAQGYYLSVLEAGGIPLIIPPYPHREQLISMLDTLDALLLSGGADIDPRYMGEEPDYNLLHGVNPPRDEQELMLVRLSADRQIPILGICRGIQTMAAALGGNVHQDIYAALGSELLGHSQEEDRGVATHVVNIEQGSLLYKLFGDKLHVNSFHHQAVSVVPEGFRVTAVATDGVIEAMETTDGRPMMGVQWHPECFILKDDNRCMMPLFHWLVDEAVLYRRAREIHANIITVDSHCDTPMLFDGGYKLEERSVDALVDLHEMYDGGLDVATMAAYLKQEARDEDSLRRATEKAWSLLNGIRTRVENNASCTALCCSPEEILPFNGSGKKIIMLSRENGYAIGTDLDNIKKFRDAGVVYMTLCHNGDNDICDSARGTNEHDGLSSFGRKVVAEMNRVGMMIDLSHASEKSFYDALEASSVPVVCSHSSCKALCDHPRNLTDVQLSAIASKGGVVQVTMYKGFLVKDGDATLDDFMRHLEHAIKVAGVEHVGIGTDFDGDGTVVGCRDASQLINVTRELLRRGYDDETIAAIWGGNWMRVMSVVQKAAVEKH